MCVYVYVCMCVCVCVWPDREMQRYYALMCMCVLVAAVMCQEGYGEG